MVDLMFTLSKKEKEMMRLFWEAGRPIGRVEILEMAKNRECSWKPNSVHILLNSLLEKQAIRVAGVSQESRRLSRTFEANVSQIDYEAMQIMQAAVEAVDAGVDARDVAQLILDTLEGDGGQSSPEEPAP